MSSSSSIGSNSTNTKESSESDIFAGEVQSPSFQLFAYDAGHNPLPSFEPSADIARQDLPSSFQPSAYDVDGEMVVLETAETTAESSSYADTVNPGNAPQPEPNVGDNTYGKSSQSDTDEVSTQPKIKKRKKGIRAKLIGRVPKKKKPSQVREKDAGTSNTPEAGVIPSSAGATKNVDTSLEVQEADASESVETVDTSLDTNQSNPVLSKKQYKKRKGQVLTKRSAKKKCAQSTSTTSEANETISGPIEEANVAPLVPLAPLVPSIYKKRKGKLSMPEKKSKKKKHFPTPEVEIEDVSDVSILNTSVAVVETGDGDDHLEYEYLHSSPQQDDDEITCSPSILLRKDFVTEGQAMQALASDVVQLLDESTSWSVDAMNTSCRLNLLTSGLNAAVERSISWTSEGMQVYIHNKPLPADSFLANVETPDPSNLSDVAQFLFHQSAVVESASICKGVTDFPQYWHTAEESGLGSTESVIYKGTPCFRSENCFIIFMDSKRCPKCDKVREKFKKRKYRVTNARAMDARKINNRYLPKLSLQVKTQNLAKEKRSLNATVKYLKKKIKKIIEQESVGIDSDISKDLCKIFKDNVSKMSDLQKMFWGEQLKAISRQRNPRSVRWSPMMIKIALHIQMQSPSTYEYLRESGILKLPSQRRLFDFTHFTEAKDGVQDVILNLMEKRLQQTTSEEHEKYFNLLFDEMTVHQSLVITKTGEIVGFSSCSDVEKSVAQLEAHLQGQEMVKEKAKKVLVFMMQGITLDMHEVVAIYPTTELNAKQLYTRVWDVVYNLEIRDMRVLSLIFDGAGCNKKFISMHVKYDSSSDFVYSTKNVAAAEDRPLFFIVDPPHLLKTIRNCFANSNGHKHTRDMWKNGEKISWEAIEMLHSVSVTEKYKIHKLTQAHVRLSPFSKMNVNLATQTMSASVVRALVCYEEDSRFKDLINSELKQFILHVNTFFDCLNGSNDPGGKRNKTNKYLQPYCSQEDGRLGILKRNILGFFQDWKENADQEVGLSNEMKERRQISDQSYQSLHITILGFCGAVKFLLGKGAPAIDAKKFNQDKLEQYFGLMRMSGGASNNPTTHEVRRKSLAYVPQKAAALPKKKGNTKGERRQLEINQEPLPCRSKKTI